jgi:hypothetical protein
LGFVIDSSFWFGHSSFPMLPIFQPRRAFHRRARARVILSPPPPATVTVVSVMRVDAYHALWTFSAPIVGEPSEIGGLIVGDHAPGGSEGVTPEGAILLAYDEGVKAGDAWLCAADDVTMSFVGGGTLVDGAGVVTEG